MSDTNGRPNGIYDSYRGKKGKPEKKAKDPSSSSGGERFSPKRARCLTIFIRIVELIFLWVLIPCLGSASRLCVYSTGYSGCAYFSQYIAINNWITLSSYATGIAGLFWAFSTSVLALLVVSIMLFCAIIDWRNRCPELFCIIVGLVVALINACLTAWYAAGWNQLSGLFYYGPAASTGTVTFMIETWVAAAIFLFLLFFVYILDAVLTAKYARTRTQIDKAPVQDEPPPEDEVEIIERYEQPKMATKAIQATERQQG